MPGENGQPFARHEAKRHTEKPSVYSRSIVPPPPTPDGYSLQLIGNFPQQLTKREQYIAQAKIDFGKETVLKQGSWDGLHVNITSVHVVTRLENGHSKQVIQYTTAPGSYFQQRLAIDETTPYETKRKLTHGGGTLFAITGDDKIVISTRPDNVQIYPRRLCATASGSWDGEYQQDPDGSTSPLLVTPTPYKVEDHVKGELHEETGLPNGVINSSALTLIGLAEESEKGHWNFIYRLQLPREITEARMREFHQEEKSNGSGHDVDPTAAHLIFIDNTPDAIERFLSDVRTPWDPLSERGLLHVGHGLILQQQLQRGASTEAANRLANQWMQTIETKIGDKYTQLNRVVRTHRRHKIHQARKEWLDAAKQQALSIFSPQEGRIAVLKRRRAGNAIGEYIGRSKRISADKTPEELGLPEAKQELLRTGVI